jgi:hypothetical protein
MSAKEANYKMPKKITNPKDAIGVETIEAIFSEYGPDLSRFPTEKQFVSMSP